MRRRLRFLEDMEAVILANRRIVPPYGMNGGKAVQRVVTGLNGRWHLNILRQQIFVT